jgi:hypothetical protein
MEKLRIFFIEAWVRANRALYRSAVQAEGLIYLFRVQPAMTDQFPRKQQYGDLVAVARPSGGLKIDVDDIDRYATRCGQRSQLAQHLLAQAAPRA